MKNFLSKKPVMITFLVLSVLIISLYIGLLVRPVAIGFTYRGQSSNTIGSYTYISDYEDKIGAKIIKSHIITTRIIGNTETKTTTEIERYYFTYKGFIVIDNINSVENDEEFNEWKQEIKDNWNTYKDGTLTVGVSKANAFSIGNEDNSSICLGSIIFAIVGGVVIITIATITIISVILNSKKGKNKQNKK